MPRDGLTKFGVAAYSLGHFGNDLCAAAWFTYVLYFVNFVVKLDPTTSASVMLSGQIADGIFTPIVGFFSDKCKTKLGKRIPWYIFGCLLVYPSFLCLFIYPDFKGNTSAETLYYITLPAIFNVGWASVQISHMSIVNSLTL